MRGAAWRGHIPPHSAAMHAQAEAHARAQADAQNRAQACARAHAHAHAEAQARVQAQAHAQARAQAQAQAEAEAEAQAEAQAQARVRAQACAQAQANAQAHAQMQAHERARVHGVRVQDEMGAGVEEGGKRLLEAGSGGECTRSTSVGKEGCEGVGEESGLAGVFPEAGEGENEKAPKKRGRRRGGAFASWEATKLAQAWAAQSQETFEQNDVKFWEGVEQRCRTDGMERTAAMLKVKWSYLQRQTQIFMQATMMVSASQDAQALSDLDRRIRVMRTYQERAGETLADGSVKMAPTFKYVEAAELLSAMPKFRQVYAKRFEGAFQKEIAGAGKSCEVSDDSENDDMATRNWGTKMQKVRHGNDGSSNGRRMGDLSEEIRQVKKAVDDSITHSSRYYQRMFDLQMLDRLENGEDKLAIWQMMVTNWKTDVMRRYRKNEDGGNGHVGNNGRGNVNVNGNMTGSENLICGGESSAIGNGNGATNCNGSAAGDAVGNGDAGAVGIVDSSRVGK